MIITQQLFLCLICLTKNQDTETATNEVANDITEDTETVDQEDAVPKPSPVPAILPNEPNLHHNKGWSTDVVNAKENNRKQYQRVYNQQAIHYQYQDNNLHRHWYHRKILRAWNERPSNHQQFWLAHEFRWLMNHEDYQGMELDWAIPVTHMSLNLYFAPEIFQIDQSTSGNFASPSNWSLQDDYNYLIKVQPHQAAFSPNYCSDTSGYSWLSEKLAQSWETNNPSKMPGYCDHNQKHYFIGHPFNFMPLNDNQKRGKTVYMIQPENMKFPRAVKNMRFRFMGAGQVAGGNLQWQITRQGVLYTATNRLIHLKSKLAIEGAPVCLVDQKPQADHDTERPLVAQKCIDSIGYFDGREIWWVNLWPQQRRWHSSNNDMYIRTNNDTKVDNVLIKRQRNTWRDTQSIFERKDELRLYNTSRKMCIRVLEDDPINLYCGETVLSERTDRPDPIDPSLSKNPGSENGMLSNTPCRPGTMRPSPFYFEPNAPVEDLFVVYSFTERQVNLRTVEVVWTKPPDFVSGRCQNDLNNSWQASVIYDNQMAGATKTILQLDQQVCTKLVIKVLQYDPKKAKCSQGTCMGIASIQFLTGMYKTQLTDECNDIEMTEVDKLFFEEPADLPFLTSHQRLITDVYTPLRVSYLDAFATLLISKFSLAAVIKEIPSVYDPFKVLDQKVAMERCEEGPCLELVDSSQPPIKEAFKNLMSQKSKLSLPEIKAPGGSKSTASLSCTSIKLKDEMAFSGQYFIKTACSSEPVKSQCDFGMKTRSWVVTNAHDFTFTKIKDFHGIKKSADLIKVCTKQGMKMGVVSEVHDLETIALLALEFNQRQHENEGVLIGYDFDCESSAGCKGDFRSLDGSTELNPLVATYLKVMKKEFTPVIGNQALVLTQGTISTIPLNDLKATATICEGEELNVAKIKCTVTFQDLKAWDKEEVICIEPSCIGKGLALQGDGVQSPNSSVCLAAEQLGEFRDQEGFRHVRIAVAHDSVEVFNQFEKNGIKSKRMKFDEAPNGYTVLADFVVDQCPEEKIEEAEKAMTFIQTSNKSKFQAKMMLRQQLNNPKLVEALDDQSRKALVGNLMGKMNQIQDGKIDDTELMKLLSLLQPKGNGPAPNPPNPMQSSPMVNQQPQFNQQTMDNQQMINQPNYSQDQNNFAMQRVNPEIANNKAKLTQNLMQKYNLNLNLENQHDVNAVQQNHNKYNDLQTMRISNVDQVAQPSNSMVQNLLNNYQYNNSFKASTPNTPVFTPTEGQSQANFPRTGMQLTKFDDVNKKYKRIEQEPETTTFGETKVEDPTLHQYKFRQNSKAANTLKSPHFPTDDTANTANNDSSGNNDSSDSTDNNADEQPPAPNAPEPDMVDRPKGLKHSTTFDYDTKQEGYQFADTGKFTKNKLYKFFVLKGDETSLRETMMLDGEYRIMNLQANTVDKVITDYNSVDKYINDNELAMSTSTPLLPGILEDFVMMTMMAQNLLKTAKKLVALAERKSFFLMDLIETLFTQMAFDLTPMVHGHVPLPQNWMKINPLYSSEAISIVNLGIVDQHTSGITVETDAHTFHESKVALLLMTRQYQLQDGSLHFSFMSPNPLSIVGVMLRYKDQFNHYKVIFDQEKKIMKFFYISSLSEPYEILMAEEEIAFGAGTWQRVVVTMNRYKFKIRVKPEFSVNEPVLEPGLSEDNRKMEVYKDGFLAGYDATQVNGRIAFFCNHCKGVSFASVTTQETPCYTRPSKFQNLTSLQNARYMENFKPPKVEPKWDLYIMGDSMDPGDWKISDAKFKISAIMPIMPTKNKMFGMGPASIIYYKDPTIVCRNYCSLKASMLWDGTDGIGAIGFKFQDPSNYQALVIKKKQLPKEHKNYKEKMTRIYIIRMKDGEFKKITKLKQFNITDKWINIEINVIGKFIQVWLDDKLLINELPEPDSPHIVDAAGSQMLGVNGVVVKFADIVISELNVPKDKGEEPDKAGNDTRPVKAKDEEDEETAAEEESGAEAKEDKSGICKMKTSCKHRENWCDENNITQLDPKCRDKFPDLCCAENAPNNTMECKDGVEATFEKVEVDNSQIISCSTEAVLGLEDNKAKFDNCLACCGEKVDYCFDENSGLKCSEMCGSAFPFLEEISTALEEESKGGSGDENLTEEEAEELKTEEEAEAENVKVEEK